MKIELVNFGPVSYFEFDLKKDLHLIIGKNNIGKSYSITCIYLLLKSILEFEGSYHFFSSYQGYYDDRELFSVDNLVSKIKNKSITKQVDIKDDVLKAINKIIEDTILNRFQRYLRGTFDSVANIKNKFSSDSVSIRIYINDFSLSIGLKEESLYVSKIEIKKSIYLKESERKLKTKKTDTEITLYACSKDESAIYLRSIFGSIVLNYYFGLIAGVTNLVKSIHYLPASRSGLYQALTAFSQIVAQLSKNRSFLTEKIELPGISVPLSDYFLELSEIKISKKNYENSAVNDVANFIEQEIVKGKVEFDTKNKKLLYAPNNTGLKLDIRSTSSMVSEISPIVAFIRYTLTVPNPRRRSNIVVKNLTQGGGGGRPKALVFIEEPEAHLHPENQLKIMEAFIKLIHADVKIIMTTHSNYIFNKLNNLFIANKIDKEVVDAFILLESSAGSIGKKLNIDRFGIDDENFVDVAEALYSEKLLLIEGLNSV